MQILCGEDVETEAQPGEKNYQRLSIRQLVYFTKGVFLASLVLCPLILHVNICFCFSINNREMEI